MSLSADELKRLQRDPTTGLTIKEPVYCAACGYCLFSLPSVGRCPECGSEYADGPYTLEGIFCGARPFPIVNTIVAIGCAVLGLWIVISALRQQERWVYALGILACLAAVLVGGRACVRWAGALHDAQIAARIRREEADG